MKYVVWSKKTMIMDIIMFLVLVMVFLLPSAAETPQLDTNSNLPYFISGVERPKHIQFSYQVKNYTATFGTGYTYLNDSGTVYWPNSKTGLIDALEFEKIYISDHTTYDKKIRFQIDGAGTPENPQYYVEIKLQSQPYTYSCKGYYDQVQTYNLDDIKTISPGFEINDGSKKDYYSVFFTETTFPYQPIGGGGGDDTNTKQNIYKSIRDLLNDALFNGEAVQGTIEYNIATIIAIICCVAIVLLPFLACWGIVRGFIWR